jgi:fructose-1-phosphate kinase PfkB-like protein
MVPGQNRKVTTMNRVKNQELRELVQKVQGWLKASKCGLILGVYPDGTHGRDGVWWAAVLEDEHGNCVGKDEGPDLEAVLETLYIKANRKYGRRKRGTN